MKNNEQTTVVLHDMNPVVVTGNSEANAPRLESSLGTMDKALPKSSCENG